jgi:hypothetical protein
MSNPQFISFSPNDSRIYRETPGGEVDEIIGRDVFTRKHTGEIAITLLPDPNLTEGVIAFKFTAEPTSQQRDIIARFFPYAAGGVQIASKQKIIEVLIPDTNAHLARLADDINAVEQYFRSLAANIHSLN